MHVSVTYLCMVNFKICDKAKADTLAALEFYSDLLALGYAHDTV
jgi:hypothetical protein